MRIKSIILITSAPFVIVIFAVVIFYSLAFMCINSDRKEVLFEVSSLGRIPLQKRESLLGGCAWRIRTSMPVNNQQVITLKLKNCGRKPLRVIFSTNSNLVVSALSSDFTGFKGELSAGEEKIIHEGSIAVLHAQPIVMSTSSLMVKFEVSIESPFDQVFVPPLEIIAHSPPDTL